jgi:hypothetical protein
MKQNIIFCDGGLANRLNTLIFALILKSKFGGNWAISWPVNNWCGAKFDTLFSTDMPIYEHPLSYYKEKENDYTLVLHENQVNFDENLIKYQKSFAGYKDYEEILVVDKPIIYYHHLIPSFTDSVDLAMGLASLKVNPEILIDAYSFCTRNNVNASVLGLHIRKTDFGNTVDDAALYEMAANSSHRFFVCSDDINVTEKFSELENCIAFKKLHYPGKMDDCTHWNGLTTDDQGRVYNFNISRSAQSVSEALVDLLILSKTTHILTSHSTFLRMSMIMKSVNFFRF